MKFYFINKFKLQFVTLFLLFGVWFLLTNYKIIESNIFPSPIDVYQAFLVMLLNGDFIRDLFASLKRIFLGLFFGTFFGIFLGLLTGLKKEAHTTIGTIIQILRPVPIVAVLPLIILWFGIGEFSKILLISWAVFMFVWIQTHMGVKSINRKHYWVFDSFKVNSFRKILHLILPSSLPYIIVGLRIAIPASFIVLVVAELSGASSGLGHMISTAHLLFRLDRMLVGIITLGILGAICDALFFKITKILVPWHYKLEKES